MPVTSTETQVTYLKIHDMSEKSYNELKSSGTLPSSINDLVFIKDVQGINSGQIIKDIVEITESNTFIINIPFTISDPNNLVVYHNGILLTNGINYSASTTQITLNNITTAVGDIFTFVGTSINPYSYVTDAYSVTVLDKDGNYPNSHTVEAVLKYIADHYQNVYENIVVNGGSTSLVGKELTITVNIPIKGIRYGEEIVAPNNEGIVTVPKVVAPVKSISVNGTKIPPDNSGNIPVTIPSAPIQSISVNSTNLAPDSSGKVNITVPNIPIENITVNGSPIEIVNKTANLAIPTIHTSTVEPTASDGNDGDIWIVYEG